MNIKDLLFSSRGRIPRSTYWIFQIVCLGLGVLAYALDENLGTVVYSSGCISSILTLLLFFPSLMVNIKRIHDRNHSGWYLLCILIPLLNIWLLVELFLLKGTAGDNQYGPDPALKSVSIISPAAPAQVQLTGELPGEYLHPSSMRVCPYCGGQVLRDAIFCKTCGKELPTDGDK